MKRMKYDRPRLIEINKVIARGVCIGGSSNIEDCHPGVIVVPGCLPTGGTPIIECNEGGTVDG